MPTLEVPILIACGGFGRSTLSVVAGNKFSLLRRALGKRITVMINIMILSHAFAKSTTTIPFYFYYGFLYARLRNHRSLLSFMAVRMLLVCFLLFDSHNKFYPDSRLYERSNFFRDIVIVQYDT